MTQNRKLILFIIAASIVSLIASVVISMLLAETYGMHIVQQALVEQVENSPQIPTHIHHEMPLHYKLIQLALLSIYWVFFGLFAQKKIGRPYWPYCLLVPVIYSMVFFDLMFPVYVLSTGIGGYCASKLNKPYNQPLRGTGNRSRRIDPPDRF